MSVTFFIANNTQGKIYYNIINYKLNKTLVLDKPYQNKSNKPIDSNSKKEIKLKQGTTIVVLDSSQNIKSFFDYNQVKLLPNQEISFNIFDFKKLKFYIKKFINKMENAYFIL